MILRDFRCPLVIAHQPVIVSVVPLSLIVFPFLFAWNRRKTFNGILNENAKRNRILFRFFFIAYRLEYIQLFVFFFFFMLRRHQNIKAIYYNLI